MTNKLRRDFWRVSNAQALGTKLATDPSMADLNADEIAEILELLAPLEGKHVLELGGGIGRFTGPIAEKAAQVTVLDISAEALDKNRERNAHLDNIDYVKADITQHEFGLEKYDVVFANWLLMYFDEDDTKKLVKCADRVLRPKGIALFRESCRLNYKGIATWRHLLSIEFLKDIWPGARYPIYNYWRLKIPSIRELLRFIVGSPKILKYRESEVYQSWFKSDFDIVRTGYIKAYKQVYNNDQQCYWLLKRRDSHER